MKDLVSVKMRASLSGLHVSGAERIVDAGVAGETVAALAERALSHPRGRPDFINIKIEETGAILRLPALKVETREVAGPAEGRALAAGLLAEAGVARAAEAMALFESAPPMRGAMLVDADTLERLEPDKERGVRATRMDSDLPPSLAKKKNHFAEALTLATKVANAPGIVCELCVSDDPDYVTGYVAAKGLGYRRITVMKEAGDPHGGRIFFYRGPRDNVAETIRYLEGQSVIVEGVPSSAAPRETVAEQMARIRAEGLYRKCRVLDSPAGSVARAEDGRELVVLSSNDYLDLARDARVAAAAADAARSWGVGAGGSRLTTGTMTPHVKLERHISSFKGAEEVVLYATGYMANVGVITALAKKGDVVFSDELDHASIIDACRLSGAEVVVYRHADMADLGRRISECRSRGRKVVVSDGVFSMDGDMLDLPRFLDVCRDAGALSVVDEAHATGVVGASGRGLSEHFGCGLPDVSIGTLSKALGAEGGFACVSAELAELLRNVSRPFIFSTAPSPVVVAAADAALSVLEAEPWRVERLRENVAFFVGELKAHGIALSTQSAIVPIPVGDERRAMAISAALEREGILVPAIRYPTVARGAARLRVAIMSSHAREQLSRAAALLARFFYCNRQNDMI